MTGWIPDVVPDAVVASSWGNTIRDRTVTPFADAAARTAAILVPKLGMVTFLQNVKRLEVWDGSGSWKPVSSHTQSVWRDFRANNSLSNPGMWTPLPAGADRTALTMAFTKYHASTSLQLAMSGTFACSSGVAAQRWHFALRLTLGAVNTDVEMCRYFPAGAYANAPFRFPPLSGFNTAGALPAGAYTVQPMFASSGGAAWQFYTPDDYMSFSVTESD
jgi:hypothetical protein